MAKTSPERLEAIKAWRKANPDKVAKNNRTYRERDPEKAKRHSEAWRKRNPDYTKKYYAKNKASVTERNLAWRAANPDKVRRSNYLAKLRRYGITEAEHQAMVARQGNLCAICGTPPPEGKSLCIDHHHGAGHVRGLLCSRCNRDLDRFMPHLTRLVAYLTTED